MRGPEELTRQLNLVYETLILEVHGYGGSVIGFSGDAITCWYNGDDGARATACGLAIQEAMSVFASIQTPGGTPVSLGVKVAVAVGSVRRFLVGDPDIQYVDTLTGAALDRMAAAEGQARKGEVIVAPEVITQLGDQLHIAEYREATEGGERFAVITGLAQPVPAAPWPTPEPELSHEQTRAWLLPPIYDRLKGGQGGFLAEIRPAVALFVGFGGIDYDADELAGKKLDLYIAWVQRVLARYEGFLLQLTVGDKGCYLYLAFGAPIAHDDDPTRAVAAALDLQSRPAELDFVGPVRIGISQGRMRAGAYGARARRTYGVLGYEVVIAARLMGVAQPGQIIISQRVAKAVAGDCLLENLGQIKVKGQEHPIPVSRVLGRLGRRVRVPVNTFPNPLVSRDAELARMAQVLAAAAGGQGQILRLQGAAGIGKSHLTAEFAERAVSQGWRVVLGACQSTGQNIPYHPWRDVFRALFVLLDGLIEGENPTALVARQIEQVTSIVSGMNSDWLVRLPLLGDLLDLPIPDNATTAAFDPQLRQEALFTLATDLIQDWARAQPLLILLEDVHWLDEASRGLTLALARVLAQAPAVLALVHRPPLSESQPILPELDDLANHHALDLEELSSEGVAAVMAQRLAGQPSPLLLDLIQLQARGNPFFVEELTSTLRELDHLTRMADGTWTLSGGIVTALRKAGCLRRDQAGGWSLNPDVPLSAADLGLPDSIHGLILARLDRLLEEHKLTLKVASVIGRVFQFQLLAKAYPFETDEATLLQQIEAVEGGGFIRLETPPPQLAHLFQHNITRDVAYESLLQRQQRELHRAVAEAIEQTLAEDAVEQLAYHYSRAGVRDKALLYLDQAARKAQRDYANETALNYYDQALALEENWEWRKGQIEVLHTLGRREEERASLERLSANPDAPDFEVAYLLGQYYQALGNYQQARADVKRAMDGCRQLGDLIGEARCLAQLGFIARRQGEYEEAKAWYNEVLALFQGDQTYPREAMEVFADASNGLGNVYLQQGEYYQAQTAFERALAVSRRRDNRRGEATALNNLGGTAYYQRDLSNAVRRYQEGLDIRKAIGDRTGEGQSLANLAMTMRDAGDYGQALSFLSEALAIQQATGNRWDEVNVWNDLGILYYRLGDLPQAHTCLEQGLRLAEDINDEAGQAYVLCNLGLVLSDRDELAAAEKLLAHGLELAERQSDAYLISMFLSYLGTVLLRAGRVEEAIARSEGALILHQETNLSLLTADDQATLAAAYLAMGDTPQALVNAQAALTILDECDGTGPEFPLQDYLFCFQVFSAAGLEEQASTTLRTAYRMVISRAEKIADPDLRQSFLERVTVNREIVQKAEKFI